MPESTKTAATRFLALDGMRGWLSLVVALAHLRFLGSYWDSQLLYGMYMMIDYFFVLSGFVIALSSRDRLNSRHAVYTFMIRRFGRVYPMHFLVLCAFIAMELLKLLAVKSGAGSHVEPFAAPTYAASALPANFLLLHSWGLLDAPTWNFPSWSISTEFYVYILFALLVFFLRQRLLYVAPLLILGASTALYFSPVQDGDATYDYGGLRCISGFFCGYLLYLLNEPTKARVRARVSALVFSIVEVVTTVAVAYFMYEHGHDKWAVLAPFIFTFVTWLFSFDAGVFSKLLMWRPIQILGEISFTTYIIHDFVWAQLERVLRMIEKRVGVPLFVEHGFWPNGAPSELFSVGSPQLMNVLAGVALLGLALLAWCISRWIEMPVLKYFYAVAKRKDRAYSAGEPALADSSSKRVPA